MAGTRHVRLTPRGTALLVAGTLMLTVGVLGGVRALVQVGALLLLTVAASLAWLLVEGRGQARGALQLTRRVTPHPAQVGRPAVVDVQVAATTGRHRLDRLQIAERAARELSGSTPLRARVQRRSTSLALSYGIEPGRRGRWPVGPLEVRRRDLFGVAGWRGPLGEPMLVAVRPAVTPLTLADAGASTDVDRAALGARTPSADDVSLRDYRTGDDLRRVHWRSSARRGALMVRQDERSGRRPASVLLDLPLDDAAAEWSISLAASAALALMSAGHHVRLLGGDTLGGAADHHRPDTDGRGPGAVLDQTVDLRTPVSESRRESWYRAALDTLASEGGGAEVVVAVVGGLQPAVLGAMARLGDVNHGRAMVRTRPGDPRPAEQRTLDGLRHAGWTVCEVHPGEDIATAWARLLASDERVVTAR